MIRSQRMIEELRTFVYKNNRPDHMDGYHDDIIMAYAMAIFVVQTSFKKLEESKKHTKAMLDSWLNITNGGNEVIKRNTNPTPNTNTPTYNQPQIRQGGNNNDNGDYNWLFGIRK